MAARPDALCARLPRGDAGAADAAKKRAPRGFDFAFATLAFDGPTLERDDQRADYGERRVIAVGLADGLHLTVVYTDRFGSDCSLLPSPGATAHLTNQCE